jgi:GMP synthase-like glutamine amidotransferase
MKVLIVNNHSKHINELADLFLGSEILQKEDFKTAQDITKYGLIIFSGGSNVPTVLRHQEFYSDEIEFIKDSKIPILGICLGAELITKAFDGELKELSSDHRGVVNLTITDPLLEKAIGVKHFGAKEGHQIGIEKMPEEFIEVAHSEHGIEIMRHKTRPIIAIQFHPEISRNKLLMVWITEIFFQK